MEPRILDHKAFSLTGWALRTTTDNGDNQRQIPTFWDQCHADGRVAALERHVTALGMFGLCAEWSPDGKQFSYFIAVEHVAGDEYPAGTRSLELPAAQYAVFTAVGAMPHAIQNLWGEIMGKWLPSSGYEHAGTPDFEVYPPFPEGDPRGNPDSPQNVSEVWIPLRKKR